MMDPIEDDFVNDEPLAAEQNGTPRKRRQRRPSVLEPPPRRREVIGGRANLARSEEHTSELQSQSNLVCRLLLEKKKKNKRYITRLLHNEHTTHRYRHTADCTHLHKQTSHATFALTPHPQH